LLLTANTRDAVSVFDVDRRTEIAAIPHANSSTVFNPDGKSIVAANRLGVFRWPINIENLPDTHVWNIGPPEIMRHHSLHYGSAISRDGSLFAGIFGTGRAHVLHLADNREVVLGAHKDARLIDVSPDGRWVATGSWRDAGGKIWDAHTGELVKTLEITGTVTPVFAPGGRWLCTGSQHEYRFWEVGSWKMKESIPCDAGQITDGNVCFSLDGRLLALTASRHSVSLYDANSFRRLATLRANPENPVTFSPDGTKLATREVNGLLRVWDLRLIRQRLRDMDLDWDMPRYPKVATTRSNSVAIRVNIDPGVLSLFEVFGGVSSPEARRFQWLVQHDADHKKQRADLERFRQLMPILRQLSGLDPDDLALQHAMAQTSYSMGLIGLDLEEYDVANSSLSETLSIHESIASNSPDGAAAQTMAERTRAALAVVTSRRLGPARAEPEWERSLAIIDAALERAPTNKWIKLHKAETLLFRSQEYARIGYYEKAATHSRFILKSQFHHDRLWDARMGAYLLLADGAHDYEQYVRRYVEKYRAASPGESLSLWMDIIGTRQVLSKAQIIETIDAATKVKPNPHQAFVGAAGNILIGRPQKGLQLLQADQQQAPPQSSRLRQFWIARAYHRHGQEDMAREWLSKAEEQYTSFGELNLFSLLKDRKMFVHYYQQPRFQVVRDAVWREVTDSVPPDPWRHAIDFCAHLITEEHDLARIALEKTKETWSALVAQIGANDLPGVQYRRHLFLALMHLRIGDDVAGRAAFRTVTTRWKDGNSKQDQNPALLAFVKAELDKVGGTE